MHCTCTLINSGGPGIEVPISDTSWLARWVFPLLLRPLGEGRGGRGGEERELRGGEGGEREKEKKRKGGSRGKEQVEKGRRKERKRIGVVELDKREGGQKHGQRGKTVQENTKCCCTHVHYICVGAPWCGHHVECPHTMLCCLDNSYQRMNKTWQQCSLLHYHGNHMVTETMQNWFQCSFQTI